MGGVEGGQCGGQGRGCLLRGDGMRTLHPHFMPYPPTEEIRKNLEVWIKVNLVSSALLD